MIRVRRTSEASTCPELADLRKSEIERVRAAIEDGQILDAKLLGTKYRAAKSALAAMHANKCCYCDTRARGSSRGEPVDHYRPKSIYWWLTWTWENLLFACYDCNLDKGASFPLDAGSTQLAPDQQPPGAERALLINPCSEDPREHIEFRLVPGGKWLPMGKTERGRATLALVCRPDRMNYLVDDWQRHVESMQGAVNDIDRAMVTEDPSRIHRVWTERTSVYRRSTAQFVALSIDVLNRRFAAEIERYALPLAVIPDPAPPSLAGPSVA